MVTIDDALLEPLFPGVTDQPLFLAVSPDIASLVDVSAHGGEIAVIGWNGPSARGELVEHFQRSGASERPATALWIASDEFEHFEPEELAGNRLGAISFFSVPFSEEYFRSLIDIIRCSDFARQAAIEQEFLSMLDDSDAMHLVNQKYGCSAVVDHQSCEHWFSLNGPIGGGQQCVLPPGELSALASASGDFHQEAVLPITGQIVFKGETLTHRGAQSTSRGRTREVYDRMTVLKEHPVVAHLNSGKITAIEPAEIDDDEGVRVLEECFNADERYAKIHELGFGTNEACQPLRGGNFFADERYPGVHFGLGLGGHLEFHFDVVCPDTDVQIVSNKGSQDVYRALGMRK